MVNFQRKILDNGLRVLVHEDFSTPLCAVNVIYDVGARDESPEKTGFAHLFEHLMFGGSANVPDFDDEIQKAGGDSNALTNNDLTNFYDILPVENIETALWLEADRMLQPNLGQESLDVQRKVVVEEFKETCLSQPYGDVWHRMADLAYQVHPYRWPTIGKDISHIENAKLGDVQEFFKQYYAPNNAALVIAGPIKAERGFKLAEKWFSEIPANNKLKRQLPIEPVQTIRKENIKEEPVPIDALYLGFHMPDRLHPDYYAYDLLSDILANGQSSRLYRNLLKDQELFSSIDAFITGSFDPGLFVVEGKLNNGVTKEIAEAAIWKELDKIKNEIITPIELEKYQNKAESSLIFSESNILNKAITLAQFEILGDAELMNKEAEEYQKITTEQIHRIANECFSEANCTEIFYKKKD